MGSAKYAGTNSNPKTGLKTRGNKLAFLAMMAASGAIVLGGVIYLFLSQG